MGRLTSAMGSVSVRGEVVPREKRQILAGDRILTGSKGRTVLELLDGTVVRMEPGTSLIVNEGDQGKAHILKMMWGKLEVEGAAGSKKTLVKTGELEFSSAQSRYTADYDPDRKAAHLKVEKGEVTLSFRGKTVQVAEGQKVNLSSVNSNPVQVASALAVPPTAAQPVSAVQPTPVRMAEAPKPKPAGSTTFQLALGEQLEAWDANSSQPYDGWEIWTPLTVWASPWKGVRLYGQTEFGQGNYTDSLYGPETQTLTNFTDSVAGFEASFNSFNLPSILNVAFNIPTGDPSWETRQTNSIIPTEFIDSRYRGRGFGMSAFYGFSMPAGKDQYALALGYMYAGAFNPNYGLGAQAEQLKLGDAMFLSMNRVVDQGGGQSDILRLSAFYFLPTLQDGQNLLQMGPNINASYTWSNPKGFSCEAGGQYFFANQQGVNGQLQTEPYNSYGPRFYLRPSLGLGNLSLGVRMKYILGNGYPESDPFYDGGGFLVGAGPSYLLPLDGASTLKLTAGFDYVAAHHYALDAAMDRVDMDYTHWTLGTTYEVRL